MHEPLRQEVERRRALESVIPIEIERLQATLSTILTARNDADFRVDTLFAANMTGTDDYVTLHLVSGSGSASAANMIASQVAIPGRSIIPLFGKEAPLFVSPGYTIQGLCGVNDAIHIYGHGVDYQGQFGA